MNAPIQIRKAELVRGIRELAQLKGTTITEAVETAVNTELERSRKAKDVDLAERRAAVDEILHRIWALPNIGPMLTDDDLYDEDGLPK
jgi:hypothetical protein